MPALIRWCIAPVVSEMRPDGGLSRWPGVRDLTDPSTGGRIAYTAAISNGPPSDGTPDPIADPSLHDWCLVQCVAFDLSQVEAAAGLVDVIGEPYSVVDHPAFLDLTPSTRGWSASGLGTMRDIFAGKGLARSMIAGDVPFWASLQALGRKLNRNFDPRRERAGF